MKETSNNLLVYSRASYLKASEEQKKRASFNNMQTVLSLHDAVEFCIRAITEEFDVRMGQQDSLMELYRVVDKHFEQQEPATKLPRHTQIRFLDTTRGKVKHHASVPSQQDTDQCFLHATYFLEQVSVDYFQTPFTHLSLVALINDEDLRQLLHRAEQFITTGKYLNALALTKLAYTKGLPSAELFLGPKSFRDHFGASSHFAPHISVRATSGSSGHRDFQQVYVDTSGIARAIQEVAKQSETNLTAIKRKFDGLEQALVHVMIGGDVLAAKRFEDITPRIHFFHNEKPEYLWLKGKDATAQMAQEALDYSTKMLLRWQDMGVIQSKQVAQNIYGYNDWEQIEVPDDTSSNGTTE